MKRRRSSPWPPPRNDAAVTRTGRIGDASLAGVGIGLRQAHYAGLMETSPPLGFIEVHSENFFADGGASIAVLRGVREQYDVSLHGVGLALGSAAGLDPWHLDKLARLVGRIDPVRVSDHASFARGPGGHANDLLPIAFTDEALGIMASNLMQAQESIGRRLLVENLSSYLSFADDHQRSEPEFFAALCRRSGCGMLLDVNNLMVNALNARSIDPLGACRAFVDALPPGIVGEIHVAGYRETPSMVIDDHGSRVRPAVWALLEHALRRFGDTPTLVEWDTDLPAFAVLMDEAWRAGSRMQATTR
jgi:uncharacterized protein (UPF0276 family)